MNPGRVMTLEEARTAGKKIYNSGSICRVCYAGGMRYTENDECTVCRRINAKKEWNRKHKPQRSTKEIVKCPCGGDTSCVTSRALKDGSRKAYQQCTECKRVWICRDGVIEGKSAIGEDIMDGRKNNGGKRNLKPTIPGARVILGRCMSGSD